MPYIYSDTLGSDGRVWGREVHLAREPVPGALEDLLLLLTALPEGISDPRSAVAIAIEDRVWTYRPGEVPVASIRADSAAMLEYALQLPQWLADHGMPDQFSAFTLGDKMHWAWRAGTAMSLCGGVLAPYWHAGEMTEELYEFWTIDRDDLEWYRDLLVGQGFPPVGDTEPEPLAREIDDLVWDNLVYTTSPESFEDQCALGLHTEEFCESYEELLYSDGLVIGEVAGVELQLWEARSPDFQKGVYADKGHFVGDCGTQTALMRAALRAFGFAATFGRYDRPDDSIGSRHVFSMVYDPPTARWYAPQNFTYLEQWAENPAYSMLFLPARYGWAYPSRSPVLPGIMGADHVQLEGTTYADVMPLTVEGLPDSFVKSFLEEEPDLESNGECSPEPPAPYLAWSSESEEVLTADGKSLRTTVYLPVPHDDTLPVILYRSSRGYTLETIARFIADGYAFVPQFVRGRPGSDGPPCLFACEQADGHATVDWLLARDWCDGRIATMGWRYGAFCALAAATHPEVDAALLVNEPALDIHTGYPGSRGRLLMVHFTAYLAYLATGTWPDTQAWVSLANLVPMADAAEVVGAQSLPFLEEFLDHFSDPAGSPWRNEHGLLDDLDKLCAPMLHLRSLNWEYQGPFMNRKAIAQQGCGGEAATQYLALGMDNGYDWMWGWQGPPDLHAEKLIDDFLAVHLAGTKTPDVLPNVCWHDVKNGKWYKDEALPETVDWRLNLSVAGDWGGALTQSSPGSAQWADIINDPVAVIDSCSDQPYDIWFESSPVKSKEVVMGEAEFSLAIRLDTPDADLIVGLYERDSEGELHRFAMGGTRLAYRNGGEHSGPMPADETVVVTGRLTFARHTLLPGSTLMLRITPQACWFHDNPNSGQPVGHETSVLSGTMKIGSGGDLDSHIVVPLIK